jgi:hypothetical protein
MFGIGPPSGPRGVPESTKSSRDPPGSVCDEWQAPQCATAHTKYAPWFQSADLSARTHRSREKKSHFLKNRQRRKPHVPPQLMRPVCPAHRSYRPQIGPECTEIRVGHPACTKGVRKGRKKLAAVGNDALAHRTKKLFPTPRADTRLRVGREIRRIEIPKQGPQRRRARGRDASRPCGNRRNSPPEMITLPV